MQSASLTGILLKTYKELLRKVKSQHGLEDPPHGSQVAALQAVTRRKFSTKLSPKRAFARLKQYLLDLQPVESNLVRPVTSGTTSSKVGVVEVAPRAVSPEHDLKLKHIFGEDGIMRAGLMFLVATLSKQLMHNTTVMGREHLEAALGREVGTPLITVSNHVSALDDPLVTATMLPEQYHQQPESLRWTLCATDRCFTNPLLSAFFRTVKVLPVERGAGLNQPGMQAAEFRLASGDWVHIFPEGTRSRDGKLGPVRKGVGRLIASCPRTPVVLPFVHRGMSDVLPRGSMMPRTGQQVDVVVGEPIPVQDILGRAARELWSEDQLYQALASRVGSKLKALHAQLYGETVMDAAQEQAGMQAQQRQQQQSGDWAVQPRLPVSWQQYWPLRSSVAVESSHQAVDRAQRFSWTEGNSNGASMCAPLGGMLARVAALRGYMEERVLVTEGIFHV